MAEGIFSGTKHTLGSTVSARRRWLEFDEMSLKAIVYNLSRGVRSPCDQPSYVETTIDYSQLR